jgi:uncharacterized protein (DUF1800 family)
VTFARCVPYCVMNRWLHCFLVFIVSLQAGGQFARAAWRTVFEVGVDDENYGDFCNIDGLGNPPPGSALVQNDDDTYLAGQYPLPVGLVAADEQGISFHGVPTLGVGYLLGGAESARRIHFMLPAGEALATAQLRVLLDVTQLRWLQNGVSQYAGRHNMVVRLNGTDIAQWEGVSEQGVLNKLVDVPLGLLINGANVVEYTRTGGSFAGNLALDRLKLEINATARQDADLDGLPEFWEQENGLSDDNKPDALADIDGDGLTALEEMARGSHPLRADTDGDGLSDGLEIGLPQGTSPALRDSDGDTIPDNLEVSLVAALSLDADGDGSPDVWELRQGTQPTVAGDGVLPPAEVIGLKFNHPARPSRAMERYRIGGVVPQIFWNNTRNLVGFDGLHGGTADVASPRDGGLVDGRGRPTGVGVSWSCYMNGFSGNSGDGAGRLTDAMLRSSATTPARVTLSEIPWAVYDVYVYLAASDYRLDSVVRLNGNETSDRWIKVDAMQPVDVFTDGSAPARHLARQGNYVRFRNVTGASCSVSVLLGTDSSSGVSAIQIVSAAADADGDGLPDWYEAKYRLNPSRNDANEDPDGDGLKNSAEFSRGTHSFKGDTDGDGLSDFVENGSRLYLGPARPGTDPLLSDTDGDGLSDGDEIQSGPFFSHPLLTDTDLDGQNDLAERLAHSNASSSAASLQSFPVRDNSTRVWSWVVDGLQIVRDHRADRPALSAGSSDRLLSFFVSNLASGTYNLWQFALDERLDGLHWRVEAGGQGMFSSIYSLGSGFVAEHPGGTATDLTKPLGFSSQGPQDISDRLLIQMELLPPVAPQPDWSLRVRCYNMDKNPQVPVSDHVFANVFVPAAMDTSVVHWTTINSRPDFGQLGIFTRTRPGVEAYFSNTRLDETPAFAAARDSDEDGLPDIWEIQSGGDPFDGSDGALDLDGDGLDQLAEYFAGTLPDNPDSDGDGVTDRVELAGMSDPLLASSTPFLSAGLTSVQRAGDFDQNGLSDAWEAYFGTTGLSINGDADGDGISNIAEASAGTDPMSAASAFRVSLRREPGDFLRLDWPALPTKQYALLRNSALSAWQAAPQPLRGPDSSGFMHAAVTVDASRQFFRVRVADRDTDGDGVNDWTESVLGTDAANASSAGTSLLASAEEDTGMAISGDFARLASLAGDFKTGLRGAGGGAVSPAMAARFLTQATFGPTIADIDKVRRMGYQTWLDDQIDHQAPYYHSTYLRRIREDLAGPRLMHGYKVDVGAFGLELSPENVHTPFLRAALQQGDQLRQRMAFALSQIFVVSRRDAGLLPQAEGLADYYDILVRNSFGNFRDILLEVTQHPVMGRYLSHVGNQKARPELSQFPDENYAREIMQLFSIGLWELHPDGSRRKDAAGADIPTYGNAEITEFARVFTGFWYGGKDWGAGGYVGDFTQPMDMHPVRHDFDVKRLLRGTVLPSRPYSREAALRDVGDAIDNLYYHPNTPPFICRQLIQFLVTSNPSPGYIKRVQDIFVNDGSGTRGNLAAVTRAILMDAEARSSSVLLSSDASGLLREPMLRVTALCRAFNLGANEADLLWWDIGSFLSVVQQKPLYAPSVFNFYRPDYKPPGPLSHRGLRAPAFQLLDSTTTISFPNYLWDLVKNGLTLQDVYQYPLDIAAEISLAATPGKLLDRLDILLCQGLMSPATRADILAAVERIPPARAATRARLAIWLCMTAPDGAVTR